MWGFSREALAPLSVLLHTFLTREKYVPEGKQKSCQQHKSRVSPAGRPGKTILLLQLALGAGGQVRIDEPIDITVHHGGDIAVCPTGCPIRRGPRLLHLRGRNESALALRFCSAKRSYAPLGAGENGISPPYFFSSPLALAVRYALMNPSISPSITAVILPFSKPVRVSLASV